MSLNKFVNKLPTLSYFAVFSRMFNFILVNRLAAGNIGQDLLSCYVFDFSTSNENNLNFAKANTVFCRSSVRNDNFEKR